MSKLALAIIGMDEEELLNYVCVQLASISPAKSGAIDRALISKYLPSTISRLALIADKVLYWKPGWFEPLSSPQYCQFIYVLANEIWKNTSQERLPTRLFLLNKSLHAIDLYFKVEMPPIFLIGHCVGIVLARATYGNFFAIFQNSTVGRVGNDVPVIGEHVIMFPNTAIIGRCKVGDRSVLSQGTSLLNRDSPGDVILSKTGDFQLLESNRTSLSSHYFRDLEFK